ncbi:MAG: hypothetical protein Q4A27_03205 [bacterium]|nr:hypothetical protein [bacterium]
MEHTFRQFEKLEEVRKEKNLPEDYWVWNCSDTDSDLDFRSEQGSLQIETAWLLDVVMLEFDLQRFSGRVVLLEKGNQKLEVRLDESKRNPIRVYRK